MRDIDLEKRYCAPNYAPLDVVLSRGAGVWLWDSEGRKYLDGMSAYSAVSLGHGHPRILQALCEQAERLAVVSRAFYSDVLGAFLADLCRLAGMDMALPMNTGAEAVETAIKAARRWGHEVKGIPADTAEIIVAAGNFHGRTTTIISFSSDAEYRRGFGPLTPGFRLVPFGDADALAAAITPRTAAVLLEPIQGENGIIIPPAGYLQKVRQICDWANVLLLLDEIQSGLCRTGKWFAFEHEGIRPDGMMVGKALGGGVLPVSAFLGKREVMAVFTPGSHGSTFGGNCLAAAVGRETLKVMAEEELASRSAALGQYALDRLAAMRSPTLRAVRGRGLWIGIDVNPAVIGGKALCRALMQRGLLTKETHEHTIRFAPPLIISRQDLDWALDRIEDALRWAEKQAA
ncbi:MAG: ornithine--oxo-acid transaminase [Proteobacteria bacterium]|nr:MAG: ornithine--oxo-acid transaminase [Pseudomonadota bacterium]